MVVVSASPKSLIASSYAEKAEWAAGVQFGRGTRQPELGDFQHLHHELCRTSVDRTSSGCHTPLEAAHDRIDLHAQRSSKLLDFAEELATSMGLVAVL